MTRRPLLPTCALLLSAPAITGCSTTTPPPAELAGLGQLAGAWVSTDGASEEHWSSEQAQTMIGMHRSVMPDESVFYEYMRIDIDEAKRVTFHASPMGASPATPFTLTTDAIRHRNGTRTMSWTFENPANDFPTRIIYTLTGDDLTARIEGERNGEPDGHTWTFVRPK